MSANNVIRGLSHVLLALCVVLVMAAAMVTYVAARAFNAPVVYPAGLQVDGQAGALNQLMAGQTVFVSHAQDMSRCTLGPAWLMDDGSTVMVTAGHCAEGDAIVYDATASTQVGVLLPQALTEVDMSLLVPTSSAQPSPYLAPVSMEGTLSPGKLSVVGFLPNGLAPEGANVCVMGSTSGVTCGWRTDGSEGQNSTTSGDSVDTMTLIGRGDVCVDRGDSGGPVFAVSADGVRIMGIVTASSHWAPLGPMLPSVCQVLYTTTGRVQSLLGGEPLTVVGK